MAKAKAKAAPRAPQVVTLSGVGNGSTTFTVTSKADSTKSDSITVEVLEISVETSAVNPPGRQLKVGETVSVTATVTPSLESLIEKGATVTWFVADDLVSEAPNSNASVEVTASDKSIASVTGVTEGGGVIICKVVLDTITAKDGSGFDVIASVEPTSITLTNPLDENIYMEAGHMADISFDVLPEGADDSVTVTSSADGVVTGESPE